ncbi:DUF3010 family protein [Vibrio sp. SS-MA-C1-2]|uniref:DUF3010 family protein n=1 Tax=Vibrio sp. SS-MA-C1-2 TaxID=2908646 RepID=UPI001F194F39|nr:DUF3010 family protein [Vibrio sp. SS-MA-C1-2]UJF18125.1 DUF3010 family protein [Vibrio sp. SS-MA-C1-2]
MRICGVELKGNDAIICLLGKNDGLFELPDCRVKKISINNALDTQQVKDFQFAFKKLCEDYKIEKVAIKQRQTKGKFAGGSVSFKLEAAIQLIDDVEVTLLSTTELKEILKRNPLPIDFRETGLKQFQEQAFVTGFAFLSQRN